MKRLVAQCYDRRQTIEVAGTRGEIDRLDWVSTEEMDDVEALPQPDQVLEVVEVAAASSPIRI
jgi:hypothetical protein